MDRAKKWIADRFKKQAFRKFGTIIRSQIADVESGRLHEGMSDDTDAAAARAGLVDLAIITVEFIQGYTRMYCACDGAADESGPCACERAMDEIIRRWHAGCAPLVAAVRESWETHVPSEQEVQLVDHWTRADRAIKTYGNAPIPRVEINSGITMQGRACLMMKRIPVGSGWLEVCDTVDPAWFREDALIPDGSPDPEYEEACEKAVARIRGIMESQREAARRACFPDQDTADGWKAQDLEAAAATEDAANAKVLRDSCVGSANVEQASGAGVFEEDSMLPLYFMLGPAGRRLIHDEVRGLSTKCSMAARVAKAHWSQHPGATVDNFPFYELGSPLDHLVLLQLQDRLAAEIRSLADHESPRDALDEWFQDRLIFGLKCEFGLEILCAVQANGGDPGYFNTLSLDKWHALTLEWAQVARSVQLGTRVVRDTI